MSRHLGAKGYRSRVCAVVQLPDSTGFRVSLRGRTAGALEGGSMICALMTVAINLICTGLALLFVMRRDDKRAQAAEGQPTRPPSRK
jgi:hypothetical protein